MNDITVQVYDSCVPIRQAGAAITLQASQTLGTAPNGADLLTTTGIDTVNLQVDGPRLSLPPDLVVGTYPAQGSLDSPDEYLPHIAIGRRTLAWERPGPTTASPWLALLLVKESEWRPANTPRVPSLTLSQISRLGPTNVAQAPPSDVLSVAPKVVEEAKEPGPGPQQPGQTTPISVLTQPSMADQVPGATLQAVTIAQIKSYDPLGYKQLTDAQTGCGLNPSTNVNVLFLPITTLANILPHVEELPLLCHVKEGPADDTLIVISNRLPNSTLDPGATAPEIYTVLLVSLEHRSDLYAASELPAGSAANTRTGEALAALVVLYQWSFTPSAGTDFADAIQAIRYTPNGGILRLGNQPTIPSTGAAGIAPLVASDGFLLTPLPLSPQQLANYRGPLQPYEAPVRSNDFAVRADPQQFVNASATDPEDYSHACAFELGRLIAINDSGIMEDLTSVRGYLDLPGHFIATTLQAPAALLPKTWNVDPADDQSSWSTEPWSGALGNFAQLPTADPSGVSSQQVEAWDISLTAAFGGAQIQGGGASIGQIATASVSPDELLAVLSDVANAAIG